MAPKVGFGIGALVSPTVVFVGGMVGSAAASREEFP